MRKEEIMYWLPVILSLIGLVVLTIWRAGISALIFWLVIGILILFYYLWDSYWLKKMYETKKEEYY